MTDIPLRNQGPCEDCGTIIDVTADGNAQFVSGWAINRYKGTNQVSCQERHQRWLCRFCLGKRRNGLPVGQEALFSE